jgi:hypothetical protein
MPRRKKKEDKTIMNALTLDMFLERLEEKGYALHEVKVAFATKINGHDVIWKVSSVEEGKLLTGDKIIKLTTTEQW